MVPILLVLGICALQRKCQSIQFRKKQRCSLFRLFSQSGSIRGRWPRYNALLPFAIQLPWLPHCDSLLYFSFSSHCQHPCNLPQFKMDTFFSILEENKSNPRQDANGISVSTSSWTSNIPAIWTESLATRRKKNSRWKTRLIKWQEKRLEFCDRHVIFMGRTT
jgi:hypothetical protein